MSEYEGLIEDFDSSLPVEDPGPLTDEENQALEEMVAPLQIIGLVEEEVAQNPPDSEQGSEQGELHVLRPESLPVVGKHYVVFNGKPMPVLRDNYQVSEEAHVQISLREEPDLKDHDGKRSERASRTIRLRYRGYLCGEINSL